MTKADSLKPLTKLETITLKAFIHCEGCRRKIRRIIRVLDGVEDVHVDSTTGKVTVTGSNIDVKTILERLHKYKKQAEVWPGANAAASTKSAGGNQPKPASNNNNSPDTSSKKKNNGAGAESGGVKPAAPAAGGGNSEGKKGGGKKEETPAADQKGEEALASSEKKATEKGKPETSKEPSAKEGGDASLPPQNGGNGGGGGGGKKGKKGGNGGGSNGSNGGAGGSGVPEQPPPHIVPDRPIASLPPPSITVSAYNRSLAPHDYIQTGYSEYNSVDYATHMFSDENANNCSIM